MIAPGTSRLQAIHAGICLATQEPGEFSLKVAKVLTKKFIYTAKSTSKDGVKSRTILLRAGKPDSELVEQIE